MLIEVYPSERRCFLSMSPAIWCLLLVSVGADVQPAVKHHTALQAGSNERGDVVAVDGQARLMRRENSNLTETGRGASLVVAQEHSNSENDPADSKYAYHLVGQQMCDGGGLWKRYEVNSVRPGKYEACAALCDAKDECVGFDRGDTGCNIYTVAAVAQGSWPNVGFKEGAAFKGEGSHDAFPQSPSDLTLGSSTPGKSFSCYRRLQFFHPAQSFFWLIGAGQCHGGGVWKHYDMVKASTRTRSKKYYKASYTMCSNICKMRDECVGFEVGAQGATSSKKCFFYTQKRVYEKWHNLVDKLHVGKNNRDKFPASPYDLSVKKSAASTAWKCYGKTNFVSLDSYYMAMGTNQPCTSWKHYRKQGHNLATCREKCDMAVECVGLGYVEGTCMLYPARDVAAGVWSDMGSIKLGESAGKEQMFAQSPMALGPALTDTAVSGASCMAKSHYWPEAEKSSK